MKNYIVALDQGTTSSRAIVFDHKENIISMAQKEFPRIYPQNGWVEHDPMEIYSGQFGVMMEAITRGGIRPEEIAEQRQLGKKNRAKAVGKSRQWENS